MSAERISQLAFFGASAVLFAVGVTETIRWSTSMSAMGEMPMPGGWTLSNAWTHMCGQTWFSSATSFIGMWMLMMVAMMLPSFVPVLWGCRAAFGRISGTCLARLTALMGAGYFSVWMAFGMVAYAVGVTLAALELQWPALARAVPIAAALVVLGSGALQLSVWKAHHLACCRTAPSHVGALPVHAGTVWQCGMRHGLHCAYCCAGLTAMLLVIGIMDLRMMLFVTVAITAERLLPHGERVARGVGVVVVGTGVWLIVRAALHI